MRNSLITILIALCSCTQPAQKPQADPDFFQATDGLVFEAWPEREVVRPGEPIRIKGVVVNHSETKESPFLMVPRGLDHNLAINIRQLNSTKVFRLMDFDLQETAALLSGESTNIRVEPGDTVTAFLLDLRKLEGYAKAIPGPDGATLRDSIVFEPGGVYEFSWNTTETVHAVSKPGFFRIQK